MKIKVPLLFFVSIAISLLAKAHTNHIEKQTSRKNNINGYVLQSDSKKPLNNVSVTAYLNDKKEKTSTTSDNGSYTFDDLKPGTYKLIFEKDGYKKITKENIVIHTDEVFQLNVEMEEPERINFIPGIIHF